MELALFFYYCVITKTLNLSLKKKKLAQIGQYSLRKISKYLWYNNIHTLKYRRRILWELFVFMELKPFLYYFVITKTQNLSNQKYKIAHFNKYLPRKKYQRLYVTRIFVLYKLELNIVLILLSYGDKAVFLLFCGEQYSESEKCDI